MRKLRLIAAFIAFVVALTVNAQERYHAEVLYGLHGNVKEIKVKSKNPLVKGTTKFIENGMKKLSLLTYNDDGYPIGLNSQGWGNNYQSLSIAYNDSKLPSMIELKDNSKKGLKVTVCTLEYDASGNLSKCTITNSTILDGKEEQSPAVAIFIYSDYQYDSEGNWISRICRQEKIEGGKIVEEQTYPETRKIKYF